MQPFFCVVPTDGALRIIGNVAFHYEDDAETFRLTQAGRGLGLMTVELPSLPEPLRMKWWQQPRSRRLGTPYRRRPIPEPLKKRATGSKVRRISPPPIGPIG